MEDSNPELERFRNQWREEVTARARGAGKGVDSKAVGPKTAVKNLQRHAQAPPPLPSAAHTTPSHNDLEGEGSNAGAYHDLEDRDERRKLNSTGPYPTPSDEPRSALEYYERAVEKESQGSLGDSLKLYRKAYRVGPYLKYSCAWNCI